MHPYFIGLIFSILLIIKLSFNITTDQKAIQADQDFTKFLDSASSSFDYLVFYPNERMISRDLFLVWSDLTEIPMSAPYHLALPFFAFS